MVERTTSGKWILRYNASLYKESNCLRKVWFTLFRGLVPHGGDGDFKMDYGTGFHHAMRAYYRGMPLDECVKIAFDSYSKSTIPDSDWRSISHLMNCVMQYIEYYKKEGDLICPAIGLDGKPMLEISFQYPFYSTDKVDVLLCGTLDFIGLYANQFPVIVDHKTTSLTQIESYLNSYVQSPQLMTYKMIHEILFPGHPIQCLINGVFLSRTNKNNFKRSSLIDFTAHQMDQHRKRLIRVVRDMVNKFQWWIVDKDLNDLFPENYTCCDQKYGLCEFLPLCMAANEDDREGLIDSMYEKRIYDPSKFQS